MIVVDTSALLAIVLGEASREACIEVLGVEPELHISAGTLTEAYVTSEHKGVGAEMALLIEELAPSVVPVTEAAARIALVAFRTFGKGRHAVRLNFGDCFSYAAARELGCPLLFIGDDFSQTDIASVL